MLPLNDALPGPHVPVLVTRGALVAHRYTYAPPRCRTSQYLTTFVLLSVLSKKVNPCETRGWGSHVCFLTLVALNLQSDAGAHTDLYCLSVE